MATNIYIGVISQFLKDHECDDPLDPNIWYLNYKDLAEIALALECSEKDLETQLSENRASQVLKPEKSDNSEIQRLNKKVADLEKRLFEQIEISEEKMLAMALQRLGKANDFVEAKKLQKEWRAFWKPFYGN